MKYSYTWLKELSGTKKSAHAVADLLMTRAFEVEDIITHGDTLTHVVVGQVMEVKKHPDADRLRVAVVDVSDEKLHIVCGAPNLAPGQKVPVALVGAQLPTKDGKGFAIKKSEIRGVESHGMICAQDELGLGGTHDGIMVLSDDAPLGESFASYYGLDDTILDIDVLPNRAHDALGHFGMACEIAALEGRLLPRPKTPSAKNDDTVIDITCTTQHCARYRAVVFDGVHIGASPQWMQARLRASDMAPVNVIVDISNYVMLLTGQPTHAFDLSKFTREHDHTSITIRHAKDGEALELLDGEKISLDKEDIVIADAKKPCALAGVMGGIESAITTETESLIFEIAHFDAEVIRATKARHNIDSDAAYRFERDLDPHLVDDAYREIIHLVTTLTGGKIVAQRDYYPHPEKPWTITLPHSDVRRLLGIEIKPSSIIKILHTLDIVVEQHDQTYHCIIPFVRRDLRERADLIEEIGRVYGYENIPPIPLEDVVQSPPKNIQRELEHQTKDFFVARGYDEVKSYAFYGARDASLLGLSDEEHVTLINPMNPAQQYMRRSLVPGLLHAVRENLTQTTNHQLCEIGRVFIPQAKGLPQERHYLALSVTQKRDDAEQFFILKGDVEQYLTHVGIGEVYFDDVFGSDDAHVFDVHPSRRALIKMTDGTVLGVIGEVTKKTAQGYKLKNVRTAVCEMDLDVINARAMRERTFLPLSRFPVVSRDLSMTVGDRTRVGDVERVLYDAGGKLLQDVALFDLYTDEKDGTRSLAFHLRFFHPERTLKAQEIDTIISQIITAIERDPDITVKK